MASKRRPGMIGSDHDSRSPEPGAISVPCSGFQSCSSEGLKDDLLPRVLAEEADLRHVRPPPRPLPPRP